MLNWWSEQWGEHPLLLAKVGWVIVSIWSPLLSPARETYQINYKASHKMLRIQFRKNPCNNIQKSSLTNPFYSLLSPAKETYQMNNKAAHKMLRTTSGPNLFYLARSLIDSLWYIQFLWLLWPQYISNPALLIECCKAIYLSLLILRGTCTEVSE